MTIYAIGDVQGCHTELQRLLEKIRFDSTQDRLWFAGDLVNRGPDSLAVLRFVYGLGDAAITVLGNHDLHLLALAFGQGRRDKKGDLDEILRAPDRDELLDWLRRQPLLHHDADLDLTMIHAGLPPQWDLTLARQCAHEVEVVLRDAGEMDFFARMYGDKPQRWSPQLAGMARLRFITNCFTRLRFCSPDGKLALREKGNVGDQKAGLLPWFEVPGRRSREARIVFGHWSTLGYWSGNNVWAIDSGCLWGGKLTALRLDANQPEPIQIDCAGYRRPDK